MGISMMALRSELLSFRHYIPNRVDDVNSIISFSSKRRGITHENIGIESEIRSYSPWVFIVNHFSV